MLPPGRSKPLPFSGTGVTVACRSSSALFLSPVHSHLFAKHFKIISVVSDCNPFINKLVTGETVQFIIMQFNTRKVEQVKGITLLFTP